MASIINKAHGILQRKIIDATVAVSPLVTNELITKAWRALILYNRTTSGKTPYVQRGEDIDPAIKQPNTASGNFNNALRAEKILTSREPTKLKAQTVRAFNNVITIYNPNAVGDEDGQIVLQTFPLETSYEPETNWAVVQSNGRNNPMYFYSGGEDTLEFEVSWYSTSEDRKDVIRNCRLLESWTKADGYTAAPPEVWISWGSSGLYDDDTWILKSAPYQLYNFQNAYRLDRDSEQIDLGLVPCCANQRLIFKKVTTSSLTSAEIRRVI